MKWRGYLIFGLLSLAVSALSVVLWMINPFTDLLLLLAVPPLRLLGYHPPVQGWSGLGSAMLISFYQNVATAAADVFVQLKRPFHLFD